MSISSLSAPVAHTCAETDFTVMESPAMGVNEALPSWANVLNSPEASGFDASKKRANETTIEERANKRHKLSVPSGASEGGFSLDSDQSIFDEDGLISFPEVATETQDMGMNCAPAHRETQGFATQPPEDTHYMHTLHVVGFEPHPPALPLSLEVIPPQDPCVVPTLPQLPEPASLSDALSQCSSFGSPASPDVPSSHSSGSPDASDASVLQITIEGMVTCLRRVSDIAAADPQLAESANVFSQIAEANRIVADVIQRMAGSPMASPLSPRTSVPVTPPSPSYELRVSEMETLWYADRPYPSVEVELVDGATGHRATEHPDCHVQVALLDGSGDPCDKLSGQAANSNFAFTVTNGVAEISGIRFAAVSSKHGGAFQLKLTLVNESKAITVPTFTSPRLQVLSYRLFHAPKVDFSKLRPNDPLSKVKGIGSLYAKRFGAIGVETVAQLAELEVDSLSDGDEHSLKLLECLRRDRGALTLTKLAELISQARSIVQRQTEFAL